MTAPQPSALAERLLVCAEKAGGKRALADAALMSESQLFRYISGDSEMSSGKAVAIAKAADVDVGWLLTGLGTMEGPKPVDPRPPFRAELMEDILRVLTEILVDFEWRLNPSQRSKYSAYAYMALRHEEMVTGKLVEATPERLMEGLWYFGKNAFDELLKIHMTVLQRQEMGEVIEPWVYNNYAEAIRQGHYQFHNSTGGDAFNRFLGLQITAHSAERLINTIAFWRKQAPRNMKWLDVGCGNGRELEYITRLNPDLDVYGVEVGRAALAQCAKFEKAGAWPKGHVVEGEATTLPFDTHSMGMVYCRGVMLYLPYFGDPSVNYGLAQAMREMKRVCVPGGVICIIGSLNVGKGLRHYNRMSREDMLALATYNELEILEEKQYRLETASAGFEEFYQIFLKTPPLEKGRKDA